jgi:serine phosphatase RsbU (regulator of sigma subunit)
VSAAVEVASARGGIARRIVALALLSACATALLLAWFGYRAETAAALRGVDDKLRALVVGADALVSPELRARTRAGEASDDDAAAITELLTRVADEAGVEYLYTCVADPAGAILIETTNLSRDERARGEAPQLMRLYERPPEALLRTFADGETRFAEYEDEYGVFRSVFRAVDAEGGRVVVAADMKLDDLKAIARANLLWQAAAALVVLVPVALLATWLGSRIARPIVALAASVRSFADDDFADDRAAVAALERLAERERDEPRTLALSILDLRRRLVRHLEDLRRVTAEKEQMTAKLEIARDIQRGLLPTEPPRAEGFEIAGWSEAADETGGDFYDWMETERGDIVLVLADVTGHGIGPSLMAAVCRAYARATLVEEAPLEPLIDRLNRLVHRDAPVGQFVTFFSGVLSPATRRLTLLSAAHGPILVYRASDRSVVETPTHGLPLGVIEEIGTDPGTTLVLEPGDVLVVVSDGFFEWANAAGEQFGTERLARELAACASGEAQAIIEHLRDAVYRFTAGTQQPDDMTALVVRALPQ